MGWEMVEGNELQRIMKERRMKRREQQQDVKSVFSNFDKRDFVIHRFQGMYSDLNNSKQGRSYPPTWVCYERLDQIETAIISQDEHPLPN